MKTISSAIALVVCCITLSNCGGGGGGGGGGDAAQVAPATLDGIELELFNAFSLKFFKLAGQRGNENGAVDYDSISQQFRVAVTDGAGTLGVNYNIPITLLDVEYTYVRTSTTTGRITLTWNNREIYPHNATEATAFNTRVGPLGDLFWGGPNQIQTNLVLDVLFGDTGTNITNTTVRVRSVYRYDSTFTAPGPAVSGTQANEFDTTTAIFTISGGLPLPAGYDPIIDPDAPSSVVFTGIQGRTIDFLGSDVTRRIAHQSSTTPVVNIPGESISSIEDSGNLLVDVNAEFVSGAAGQYSYIRTGGSGAKLTIRYIRPNSGSPQTVTVTYTLTFTATDGGTFVDSNGATGTFLQDNFTNT